MLEILHKHCSRRWTVSVYWEWVYYMAPNEWIERVSNLCIRIDLTDKTLANKKRICRKAVNVTSKQGSGPHWKDDPVFSELISFFNKSGWADQKGPTTAFNAEINATLMLRWKKIAGISQQIANIIWNDESND